MIIIFGLKFESFPGIYLIGIITLGNLSHISVFAVFTFLLAIALKKQYTVNYFRNNGVKIALVSGVVYGTLMEFFQLLIFEGRSFAWTDVGLNIAGSGIGVVLFYFLYKNSISMG